MRVLLVEDSDELVTLLKKGLAQGGFSADAVGTAADADHALSAMRYAAVVLDRGLLFRGPLWFCCRIAHRPPPSAAIRVTTASFLSFSILGNNFALSFSRDSNSCEIFSSF